MPLSWFKKDKQVGIVKSPNSGEEANNQLSSEILDDIKKLHFSTRKIADEALLGGYKSTFKGRGIEFEDVREYIPGDDIRSIDWKVTARSGQPFVKRYREERELSVMVAVDVSASAHTGSSNQTRERLAARVGAVLTMMAMQNGDKVGLVTHSDQVEKFYPPRKSRNSVWRIIREVMTSGDYNSGTDLFGLNKFLRQVLKRRSVIFIISDFFDPSFGENLAQLSSKHDVTAVVIEDPLDHSLPNLGLLTVKDPETGQKTVIDTSQKRVREKYQELQLAHREKLVKSFRKYGVGSIWLGTDKDFIPAIRSYFLSKERGRKLPLAVANR